MIAIHFNDVLECSVKLNLDVVYNSYFMKWVDASKMHGANDKNHIYKP